MKDMNNTEDEAPASDLGDLAKRMGYAWSQFKQKRSSLQSVASRQRNEWIRHAIALAVVFKEGHDRFPSTRKRDGAVEFHKWRKANKLDNWTGNEQTALVGIGTHSELARKVMEAGDSVSLQLIWRKVESETEDGKRKLAKRQAEREKQFAEVQKQSAAQFEAIEPLPTNEFEEITDLITRLAAKIAPPDNPSAPWAIDPARYLRSVGGNTNPLYELYCWIDELTNALPIPAPTDDEPTDELADEPES